MRILHRILLAEACTGGRVGFTSLPDPTSSTDMTLLNLQESVFSIQTTVYEAKMKFGEIQQGVVHWLGGSSLINFTSKGMISEVKTFDLDGKIQTQEIRQYNNSDKIAEINLSNLIASRNQTLNQKITFTYNQQFLSSITSFDPDEIINYKILLENDGRHYIRQMNFEANGELQSSASWKYDDDLKIEYLICDNQEHPTHRAFFEYTPEKQWSKLIVNNTTICIEYDTAGNIIKIVNGKIIANNSLVVSDGDTYFYDYVYDDHSNWIKQIAYLGNRNSPSTITERIITYTPPQKSAPKLI